MRQKLRVRSDVRGGSREWVQGMLIPPPSPPFDDLQHSKITSKLCKICCIICFVFSSVHILLKLNALSKPSFSLSVLKFVWVTYQLCHSLGVDLHLRKILDPPLDDAISSNKKEIICFKNNKINQRM